MEALEIIQLLVYIGAFLSLILISANDNANSIIPNGLSLGFGALAFVHYLINVNSKNWWLPLVVVVGTFLALFLLFCITGESLVGGGDMKILLASLLMLNSGALYEKYIISVCCFTLLGALIALVKREKRVRCGVYYALSILTVILPLEPLNLAVVLLIFLVAVSLVEFFVYDKERCFYEVQAFKEI